MTRPRTRTLVTAVLAVLYAVMWVGGVSAYVWRDGPRPGEEWTAPAFLLLAALLVLVTTRRRDAWWLVLILLLGFATEYAGVRCGCVFGPYTYTAALSPRVLGVPIAISAAWMVLIAYVRQVGVLRGWSGRASSVLCALWMTAIDLVLEPLAAGPLQYWTWLSPGPYFGVPLRNFAGWFVVSLLMFALLSRSEVSRNPWARYVGLTIVAFFAIIAASHRLIVPAVIGAALCALDLRRGLTPV